jgi:hypothetical protein
VAAHQSETIEGYEDRWIIGKVHNCIGSRYDVGHFSVCCPRGTDAILASIRIPTLILRADCAAIDEEIDFIFGIFSELVS